MDERAIRFWQAHAMLQRAAGDFDMANRYEEYALAAARGERDQHRQLRGFPWQLERVGSRTIDLDLARAALTHLHAGDC